VVCGGVIFVPCGRRQRAAASIPADMVDHHQELLEERDARLADEPIGRHQGRPSCEGALR
jgi:hypothetical protein